MIFLIAEGTQNIGLTTGRDATALAVAMALWIASDLVGVP